MQELRGPLFCLKKLVMFLKSDIQRAFYSYKRLTVLFINMDHYKLEFKHDLIVSGQEILSG